MLAKKIWRIVAIRQIRQSFLPAKVLFYTVTTTAFTKKCMVIICTYLLIYLHPVASHYLTGIKLLLIFYLRPYSAEVLAYATAKYWLDTV